MFINYLLIIFLSAYLVRTLRNLLYHLFWWEKKEYRFDRMFIHLKETEQGKKWLLGPLSLIKWLLLMLILMLILMKLSFLYVFTSYLVYLVFTLEAIRNIFELKVGWKIPSLKPRNISILLITLITLYSCSKILIVSFNLEVIVLLIDKLLGPVVALVVYISSLIFLPYKKLKIIKATKKIQQANKLQIIGITGSYGKTTTKELIAQILSHKYKVLKTLGSQNTDIGIAERILTSNLSQYDYFVCEMAAYKRGEIVAICNIFQGKIEIGVITGINEQHQSLFGSLKNTQIAKFELIEALNPHGLAIFNGRSKHIEKMVKWAKEKQIKTVVAGKVTINKLPVGLHGKHFQENLSIAIVVASNSGMNESEINEAIAKVQLPAKTMNIINKGKVTYIDDTFNANPDGVYQALEYLKLFKGKKIFVLQPLIELGNYVGEVHRKIGRMAAEVCDEIILTNQNFNQFIIEGVNTVVGGKDKIKNGKISLEIKEGVVLFEGKEAEKYLYDFR